MVSRVKVGGAEKWVGFIGGGHNYSSCTGTGCDTRGKGFFVVELSTGNVLWSHTLADNSDMAYAMPGTPTMIDSDNDGFIDLAYIGDLGGNLWRFKFCSDADGVSCSTGNWTGSRLFARESRHRARLRRPDGDPGRQRQHLALLGHRRQGRAHRRGQRHGPVLRREGQDPVRHGPGQQPREHHEQHLHRRLQQEAAGTSTSRGAGEKCLSDSSIFGGQVYFTTYTPASGMSDPCSQAGTAKLYAVSYISGAGSLTGGSRSMTLGVGIPTAPVLSMNPYGSTPDLYVTVSGGAGIGSNTQKANVSPPSIANRTNILHWRDRRIQ